MVQEKDPSADAAFAAVKSLQQQSMQSAAGDTSSAVAVDGFVPRLKPNTAPLRQPKPAASESSQASAPQHTVSESSRSTCGQPQAQGGDRDTSQPTESSVQQSPSSSRSTAGNTLSKAQNSIAHSGLSQPTPNSTPPLAEQPGTSDQTGTASRDHSARLNTNLQDDAAVPSDDGSSSAPTAAQPVLPGQVEIDAHPVISFEVEDAEGPLEGAEHGINAKFGRLTVRPCTCLVVSI